MRTHRNHQQYAETLSNNIQRWLKRKSRKLPQDLLSAALILIGLDAAIVMILDYPHDSFKFFEQKRVIFR